MAIEFYKEFGDFGYLANYSNHGFTVDGVYYPTVEHYYQASKFQDKKIIQKILKCKSPKEASIIGRDRKNPRIPNFRNMKNDKMYEGVYYKFSQNKDIRSKLIETRNQEIKEMSVKESYWGVGPNLDGENHIGQILMKVREQIKKDLIEEIIRLCQDETVYVIGHAKPDADSIFSSLILTHILQSRGVHAIFAVRDEDIVDDEMIQDYLAEKYVVVDDYSNKKFILVDHNKLSGIPKENVIASFDHHRISGEVENLIEIEYASCCLLIYDLFRDSYPFTTEEKTLVGLSVLSDTEFLTSSRFGEEDKKIYDTLDVSFDIEKMKKKYLKITDFSSSISSNFFKDYKEYDYNGQKICRSIIKGYSREKNKYFEQYRSEMEKNHINLMIWCDYEQMTTTICFMDKIILFPYFTTSTTLVLDYLKKEKYLD